VGGENGIKRHTAENITVIGLQHGKIFGFDYGKGDLR